MQKQIICLYIDQNSSLKFYVHISKTNAEHDQKFDITDSENSIQWFTFEFDLF